ncbi:hypothetical protein I33_0277 [Bacillus subtilis subsp. subtilis str. RO-NN-1]|uniref:Uncharacterized protein n=1 Tax=Bacillus subtilis TaxID=1423 RepID=A0A0D1JF42_BACIU|nr:hypothetical protein I33_0277 [Bacillus subtilis subsp. subtilis str. RO-NN-1]KIU11054.1 hypothetical protein SC09_Contig25orf00999 [Bacillus subtilis]
MIRRSTPINFRIFFRIISYYTPHSLSDEAEIKEKQPVLFWLFDLER